VISVRRHGTAALVTAVVAVVGGAGVGAQTEPGTASSTDRNVERLDTARDRARQASYEGTVVVWWRDGSGNAQREIAAVRATPGATSIGDETYAVPEPGALVFNGRMFVASNWKSGAPRADDKYDVTSVPGDVVAGHSTTMLEARRDADGRLVERFWLSDDTGLVLRRDSFDEHERRRRSSGFAEIVMSSPSASLHATPVDGSPDVVSELDPPYRDPSSAGDGFRLVARWRHPNGVVQLSYSDGLLTASVFEQRGRLHWDALPSNGHPAHVNGEPAVAYSLPQGEALVWERGGIVYTAVGDAPSDELFALAAGVSRRGNDGPLTRLARVVLSPFRW
jgi:sigma-E factor negative regulatory protein RseB